MALAQPSKLPAAQAARREKMITLHAAPDPAQVAAEEAARVETAAKEAATAEEAARLAAEAADPANQPITLTQAQLDERMEESNRAAALARMEADELRAQLTAAERARKEEPRVVAAPDLGFSEADVALTADETELYGASEAFVVKLIRREIAAALAKFNGALDARLVNVEKTAGSATEVVQKANQKRFSERVMEKAPDVQKLVGHAKFKEFMQTLMPMAGITYNEALNKAHATENLKDVLAIFDAFRTKVGVTQSSTAGYAGASGSAAAAEPAPSTTAKRFTMAERQAKSQALVKGQITKEQFAAYKTEFDAALADGRVD